jgi:hypothetical protein
MVEIPGKIKIGAALTFIVSLAVVLLAPSPAIPAVTCLADGQETPVSIDDYSQLPPSLVTEAEKIAADLFDSPEKQDDFTGQLLGLYALARDKDVLIFFNPGGFGWTELAETREGFSFMDGISAELDKMGMDYLFLNHKRTFRTFNSSISEFLVAASLFPFKAEDLTARVDFLTHNVPGLKIVLIGISNGTLPCDGVMDRLEDNPNVLSIQLGPPSWNNAETDDRSLVLRSNGTIPDSFSQGDMITILRANIEALYGVNQEYTGDIMLYIGAPGHDYNWGYQAVRSQLTKFLWDKLG